MHTAITNELMAKFAKVKMLLCDVDGILTDASVFIGLEKEIKRFHIRDGLGIMMLRKEGVLVGWVSARPSIATTLRAEELKIDFLVQDKGSKVQKVEALLAETGLKWEQICYMGDDVVDLGVLRRAGAAATAADAIAEAKAASHYITQADGGHGAVREVVDLILKAQNRWDGLVAEHSA
jgi:3-deoxy-D-manno-octulosonate 8-phosphate phosphatase (KDO 8-P phosphatase)